MKQGGSRNSKAPSRLIDERIRELWDWRGKMLSRLRAVVKAADPALNDPSGLFNASLEGNTRRAIDFHGGEKIDEKALKTLIRAAVSLNTSRAKK